MKTKQTETRRKRTPKQSEQFHIAETAESTEYLRPLIFTVPIDSDHQREEAIKQGHYREFLCNVCGDKSALAILGNLGVCGECALERDKEVRCIGCGSRYDDPADEKRQGQWGEKRIVRYLDKDGNVVSRWEEDHEGLRQFLARNYPNIGPELFVFHRVQKQFRLPYDEGKGYKSVDYLCCWCLEGRNKYRKSVEEFISRRINEGDSDPHKRADRSREEAKWRDSLFETPWGEPLVFEGSKSKTQISLHKSNLIKRLTYTLWGERYGKRWKDHCVQLEGIDLGVWDDPDDFPFERWPDWMLSNPKQVVWLVRIRHFYKFAWSYFETRFRWVEVKVTTGYGLMMKTEMKCKLEPKIVPIVNLADSPDILRELNEGFLRFGEVIKNKVGRPSKGPATDAEFIEDLAYFLACCNYEGNLEPNAEYMAGYYRMHPTRLSARCSDWGGWKKILDRAKQKARSIKIEDVPASYLDYYGLDLK